MGAIAATVSELIEILQQYPGDWPLMALSRTIDADYSALHGFYIYEVEANQVKDYFYNFYERGNVPEGKTTIPALLLAAD